MPNKRRLGKLFTIVTKNCGKDNKKGWNLHRHQPTFIVFYALFKDFNLITASSYL